MELYRFRQGSLPLLVSMPHCGTHVPPAIAGRLTGIAQSVPDTAWHMPQLYDFLPALGASVIEATPPPYDIHLNPPSAPRPPHHTATPTQPPPPPHRTTPPY